MKSRAIDNFRVPFTLFMVAVFLFTSLGVSVSKVYAQGITTPAAPNLLSPSGPIWVLKPPYKWNPSAGATSYVLKVTNTDTAVVVVNSNVSNSACAGMVCSYTPAISLSDGNYQFEVAAKNSNGQSAFSTPMTFKEVYHTPPVAPNLLSPSGPIRVLKPPYKWNPSGGATSYVLKVTNIDTSVVVINSNVSKSVCKGTVCSYTPAVSLKDGNYKFEVAAKNIYGQSAFSTPMTFQEVYHTPPAAPNLLSPSTETNLDRPTFKWNPSVGSTGYALKVTNIDTPAVVYNSNVSKRVCKGTVCSYTPAISLVNGNYKFEVAAKNIYGQSIFNSMTFTVFGFNSQFKGSAKGWIAQKGGLWKITSSTYYTAGKNGMWSTSRYTSTYTDFDYAARVKRVGGIIKLGSTYYIPANAIYVRMGGSIGSTNDWYPGYYFAYYDPGSLGISPNYGIWRLNSDGTETNIIDADTTAVIKKKWNILRVTASGSTLSFYINNTLMYTFTDSTFSSGAVGVGMYKGTKATTKFIVDWATLGHYASGALSASISPEQQALNEAGKNTPSDQITIEEYKYTQP